MDTPNNKTSQKFGKNNSQTATPSTRRGRSTSPQQSLKNQSWVCQKPQTKENTKPVDFKLRTQERAVQRAIFNYTVATKLYLVEQQKKQVEKLHKMIEEEEVRMMRKEMIPRAQLMPLFDRPFLPQRSTRPLTVPKERRLNSMNGKSMSCF
ncbi:hypothetical protein LguiA_013795 [Lonicera macranthoides]